MIKLPYSILPVPVVRKLSNIFLGVGEFISKIFPELKLTLKQAGFDVDEREYLSMCFVSNSVIFFMFTLLSHIFLQAFEVDQAFGMALVISGIITVFIVSQQIYYPQLVAKRRAREIERNLLSSVQNMLVQLNSGVSLFEILVNLSRGEFGEVSKEFARAVREINAGKPQIEALEDLATANPSEYFRRTIWQIVNGMKSGSDLSNVIQEIIDSISEEQVIQIQKYGSQLSPLAMFYMMIAVIIPSLGMAFLIIIASFISLEESTTKTVFWTLYFFVVFFQIMFLGVIKSRRPNLI